MPKADGALLTIGEVADRLGIPRHRLRFWESRFRQLRPVQLSGQRRYYRPADVALVARIQHLLEHEGYTIAGVQRLLRAERGGAAGSPRVASGLADIRDRLAMLLDADRRLAAGDQS